MTAGVFSYILDKGLNDSLRCVSDEKCFLFVDEMYRLLQPGVHDHPIALLASARAGGLFVTFSLHTDFRDAKELSRCLRLPFSQPIQWLENG